MKTQDAFIPQGAGADFQDALFVALEGRAPSCRKPMVANAA